MVERDDAAVALDQAARLEDRLVAGTRRVAIERRAHAETLLIHWSSVTATMISTPTVNSCQSTSRPESARPLRNTPTIKRADQRADDRAAPAEEAGAADHHGGDGVEVGGLPGLRADAADAADQHPGGDGADQAGERVDRDQRAVGVDAGEARRVGIVAGRVDVAAEGGAVQHVPDERPRAATIRIEP